MPRVAVANHAKLSWLLLRGAMRRLAGRANGHPLVRWPLPPLKADRLLISPQDLRTADGTRATEIYSGRFAFAGKVVVCDGRSIFEMEPPSDEWAAALFGFGWLRHLSAADSGITRANARALVDEWITLQGSWHPLAWRPDVLSRRIISWLSQASLVLNEADVRFYRRFLRSLVRQVRYLRHTAGDARRGVARMQAVIALSYAALCIAGQARHIKSTTARLKHELEWQILPDGGHVSRDPGAIIEILLELLPLRQAFSSRNIARLQTAFGVPRVKKMLLLADYVTAQEALACGYVYEVCGQGALEQAAHTLAQRLIALSPVTQKAVKESLRRIVVEQRFDDEDLIEEVYGSDRFRDAVAAFISGSAK